MGLFSSAVQRSLRPARLVGLIPIQADGCESARDNSNTRILLLTNRILIDAISTGSMWTWLLGVTNPRDLFLPFPGTRLRDLQD